MSSSAITEAELLREYNRELHNKNTGIFIGAGMSMPSGYVDWKGLLRDVVTDLGLDPNRETDLVTLAQYHCNKTGGNKALLTQKIFDHFGTTNTPTENHRILARLPIHTFWTTNYDKLIERSLVDAKKVVDVKYALSQLPVTRQDRDVALYKMHGDVDHPADAIISRDDYESYGAKMEPFLSALRGDLIEKTFLFLGFSFTDPNIDYVLSRVRVRYGSNQRPHYTIQKRVARSSGETESDFEYRKLKQHYFINDLSRFSIRTVLVDEYSDITRILRELRGKYKRSSVFISGAAEDYAPYTKAAALEFLHEFSAKIISRNQRVVTGFGSGVGWAVLNGAIACLSDRGKTITDEDVVLRPFPQIASGGKALPELWNEYREAMIDYAGIAVFVFGNKRDSAGNLVQSDGMKKEFDICVSRGVKVLPVGSTGYMARTLWEHVHNDMPQYFPNASTEFLEHFRLLGDSAIPPAEMIAVLFKLIDVLQRG